jgi:hypothetical protein
MKAKTTDGHELSKYGYYHTVDGQVVHFDELVTNHEGELKYIVIPIYEGDCIFGSGAGGSYGEHNVPYEHEGEPIIVSKIFKKGPNKKMDKEYLEKKEKLDSLSVEIKSKLDELSELKKEEQESLARIEQAERRRSELEKDCIEYGNKFTVIMEDVYRNKTILKETVEAIDVLKSDSSVEEIKEMRKKCHRLECLENGGVDNWEWYGEAIKEYEKEYGEDD